MESVKLVFVDDDSNDRNMIDESLKKMGATQYLVLESSCALLNYLGALADNDLPEAIVLDMNMPEMDGLEILKHLKSVEGYQQIPVYLLTTTTQLYVQQQCITGGAAGFYTKPTSIAELDALLHEIYNTV